jgi:hypothetical protein
MMNASSHNIPIGNEIVNRKNFCVDTGANWYGTGGPILMIYKAINLETLMISSYPKIIYDINIPKYIAFFLKTPHVNFRGSEFAKSFLQFI